MRTERTRNRIPIHVVWGILIVSLLLALLALPALAQDPVVTAADPPAAEQETYDLDVEITGDNFGKDSEVAFYVSCPPENPDCTPLPGGIQVKGNPKLLGPKKLKVTIDVDADAVIDDFDIHVMSRGRTGKGIELFRVMEKTHPNEDTIPPGQPADLQVLEVKFGSLVYSYTLPADDGYDPASGSIRSCMTQVRRSGEEELVSHWGGRMVYPHVQPGEEEVCLKGNLDPATAYDFSTTCEDYVGNRSAATQWTATTLPFSAFQDPSWAITEVPVFLDRLIGHRVDPAGRVILAGFVGTWDGNWKRPRTSSVIRVVTGTWDDVAASWTWSFEDVQGFADRLEMDPGGRPAFAGQEQIAFRPRYRLAVSYTHHDGAEWVREVVGEYETEGKFIGQPGFAFDPFDEPAISWCAGGRSPGVRLARRDAPGQWSVEAVNSSLCDAGYEQTVLAFDEAGTPGIIWVHREDPYELRFSHQTSQGWAEESVDALPPEVGMWWITPVALAFDPLRADFTAVWWSRNERVSVCDRAGGAGWSCNVAEPYGSWTESNLALDAAGELFLGLSTDARLDVALTRRLPGQSSWTLEEVDYRSTRGFSAGEVGQVGPLLALDTTGRPTLSWMWGDIDGVDGPSGAVHLYFAWKP